MAKAEANLGLLASDPAFSALDRWRQPLSMLRVLGKARDELAHSRITRRRSPPFSRPCKATR